MKRLLLFFRSIFLGLIPVHGYLILKPFSVRIQKSEEFSLFPPVRDNVQYPCDVRGELKADIILSKCPRSNIHCTLREMEEKRKEERNRERTESDWWSVGRNCRRNDDMRRR